jgi:hypothetical protein
MLMDEEDRLAYVRHVASRLTHDLDLVVRLDGPYRTRYLPVYTKDRTEGNPDSRKRKFSFEEKIEASRAESNQESHLRTKNDLDKQKDIYQTVWPPGSTIKEKSGRVHVWEQNREPPRTYRFLFGDYRMAAILVASDLPEDKFFFDDRAAIPSTNDLQFFLNLKSINERFFQRQLVNSMEAEASYFSSTLDSLSLAAQVYSQLPEAKVAIDVLSRPLHAASWSRPSNKQVCDSNNWIK